MINKLLYKMKWKKKITNKWDLQEIMVDILFLTGIICLIVVGTVFII